MSGSDGDGTDKVYKDDGASTQRSIVQTNNASHESKKYIRLSNNYPLMLLKYENGMLKSEELAETEKRPEPKDYRKGVLKFEMQLC